MKPRRDLLVVNLLVLPLLVVVLLIGWWQEAAVGLVVLVALDLFVLLRGHQARAGSVPQENQEQTGAQK